MRQATSTRAERAPAAAPRRVTPRQCAFFFLLCFAASVPLEAIAHLGPLGSTARIAGIAAAASGAYALCTDLHPRPANRTFFVAGGFVAWVCLSYFWSGDPIQTFARAVTCVQLLLLAWLIGQEARTSRACVALMKAYVAGAAIACADAIVTRRPAHNGVVRFSVGDPNDFGVVVVIAMIMAYYVAMTSTSRRARIACACFLPLGALAVFLTASRTAVLALLVAVLVMVFDPRNLGTRRLVAVVLMAVVMAFLVVHFVSKPQLDRIASARSEVAGGSLDQRTTQWSMSVRTFDDHPILGIGAGTFRDVSARETGISSPAHSVFLGVLADTGAIGLVLFVAMIATLVPGFGQLRGMTRRAWTAIAVIWLMGAFTLSWEHRKVTWFLVFLLAAHVAASRDERAAHDVPAHT